MKASAPEIAPAISIQHRKDAPGYRVPSQSSSPSLEQTFPPKALKPHPASGDWPRRYSHTARASLAASSCPPAGIDFYQSPSVLTGASFSSFEARAACSDSASEGNIPARMSSQYSRTVLEIISPTFAYL